MSQPEVHNGLLQSEDAKQRQAPLETREGRAGFTIHGNPAPLFCSLAKAQGAFTAVERTKLVKVRSEKGSYDFWYAPLDQVLAAVMPALSANGLALMQPLVKEGPNWVLRTMLAHESGSYIEGSLTVPTKQGDAGSRAWQDLGSAVTYARRYMVGALLGIAPEEDDDGAAAEDMPRETQSRGPRQNTRPTPPQAQQKGAQVSRPREEVPGSPGSQAAPAGEGSQRELPKSPSPERGASPSKAETEATGSKTSAGAVDSREGVAGDAPKPGGQSASPGPVALDLQGMIRAIGDALKGGRLNRNKDGEIKWFTKATADALAQETIKKPVAAITTEVDAKIFLSVLKDMPEPTAKQREAWTKLRAKFGKDREQADLFCADIIGHQSDWVCSEQECDELLEALAR